jgi:hypothetical protein
MATPVILVLAAGLTENQVSTRSPSCPEQQRLQGTLRPTPELSPAATRAIILSGLWVPKRQEPQNTLLPVIERNAGPTVVCKDPLAVPGALRAGAALVLVEAGNGESLPGYEELDPYSSSNTFVIGHATGREPGALLACGPDICPQTGLEAELTDIRPTLLSHFGVPPVAGPIPEGRALHEAFKSAHLSDEEQNEVIAHLRAVGYIA